MIAAYVYDNLDRRASMSRANGVSTTYAYDGVSRLTGLTHGGAANVALSFTHNPAGQIANRTASNPAYAWAPPATTTTYTLDRHLISREDEKARRSTVLAKWQTLAA